LIVDHLPILPVVLPAFAGALLLLVHGNIRPRRAIGIAATLAYLVVAVLLLERAIAAGPVVYETGDWPAPFGIVLVADRLAALMILVLGLIAVCAVVYARAGWDTRGRYFHAFFQFQLMGISGAFLTGDLFNLFVFFEVLLIASYCLLLHGLGAARVRAAVHYVVLNLIGSALFLIAAALLYGVTGTLNIAHLAVRVGELAPADQPVAAAAGLILFVVFALKAASFPMHFWLPAAYAAAAAPVAALFAIMTKVGVYAIVRIFGVVFGADAGPLAQLASPWLLPLAIATMIAGVLGALASRRLAEMVAFLTVSSVGTMLVGLVPGTEESVSGSLFYMVHSTFTVAALFLVAELLGARRGPAGDEFVPAPRMAKPLVLGTLFVVGAASIVGLPPFSGFLGKVMILQGTSANAAAPWIWASILGVGFLMLIGVARGGAVIFWANAPGAPGVSPGYASAGALLPAMALASAGIGMAVFAAPIKAYTDAAAGEVVHPQRYVEAVLAASGGSKAAMRKPLPAVNER
jgi:multicomponent K+:H+ antiporter subunit D